MSSSPMPTMYHSLTALHIDRFPGKTERRHSRRVVCAAIDSSPSGRDMRGEFAPTPPVALGCRPGGRREESSFARHRPPARSRGRGLLGVAPLTPARAANARTSRKATPAAKTRVAAMSNDLSADEIRTLLQLEPNATCGLD